MIDEICVIGFPSRLGGADTELDHQIHVWQKLGVRVHLIHTGPLDANCHSMDMESRDCVVHPPRDWSACRDKHVISYCNGEFLKHLSEIRSFARSATFVNCMTWLFDKEKQRHREGLIDFFLYQTEHVLHKVEGELREINSEFRPFLVRPYFHFEEFPFQDDRSEETFRFARISRNDPGKFHQAQLWVYETMVAPVLKDGIILGIDDRVREKIGREPNWIRGYGVGEIPVRDIYARSHSVIQMADTYENLPRVGFEAMASGCLLIVDDRGGWRDLVLHGQTGFLCQDQREFVYYASRAAFEREERLEMTRAARRHLESNWSSEASSGDWKIFFDVLSRYGK